MGLFDKLKKTLNRNQEIYTPVVGTVIPLKAIADGVFSEGILGPGAGIEPEDGVVYAPFDGKVIQVADTKHALGLESKNGLELLVHVGMDTVAMNGKGFDVFVKEGDSITRGQKLMNFSMDAIKEAGYRATTAVIVTNSDQYESVQVLEEGRKNKEEVMIQIG
jgi:glucose-specific phosphotransferase system IIA component